MPGPQQPQQKQQTTFNQPQEQSMQTAVKGGAKQPAPAPGQQPQGQQQPGGPVPPGLRAPYYSPAPPQQQQQSLGGGQGYFPPAAVPEFKAAGVGAAPWGQDQHQQRHTRFNMSQLRQTDGIVPLQYGTNRYASQRGMTGFGSPRDVNGKHLHRIWDDLYTDEGEAYGQPQQFDQYQ